MKIGTNTKRTYVLVLIGMTYSVDDGCCETPRKMGQLLIDLSEKPLAKLVTQDALANSIQPLARVIDSENQNVTHATADQFQKRLHQVRSNGCICDNF